MRESFLDLLCSFCIGKVRNVNPDISNPGPGYWLLYIIKDTNSQILLNEEDALLPACDNIQSASVLSLCV